ncbi:MAG: Transcriptional regulator, HxlR family, partial [uncultured Craurococcus sp.]
EVRKNNFTRTAPPLVRGCLRRRPCPRPAGRALGAAGDAGADLRPAPLQRAARQPAGHQRQCADPAPRRAGGGRGGGAPPPAAPGLRPGLCADGVGHGERADFPGARPLGGPLAAARPDAALQRRLAAALAADDAGCRPGRRACRAHRLPPRRGALPHPARGGADRHRRRAGGGSRPCPRRRTRRHRRRDLWRPAPRGAGSRRRPARRRRPGACGTLPHPLSPAAQGRPRKGI